MTKKQRLIEDMVLNVHAVCVATIDYGHDDPRLTEAVARVVNAALSIASIPGILESDVRAIVARHGGLRSALKRAIRNFAGDDRFPPGILDRLKADLAALDGAVH